MDTTLLVFAAAGCVLSLSLTGCAARAGHAASARSLPPTPQAAEEPISTPQTQETLPRPQPLQAAAVAIVPPEQPAPFQIAPAPPPPAESAPPQAKPRPRPEPRATVAPPTSPTPTPVLPRRIRPVASAAERRRLETGIAERRRKVQAILARARLQTLSEGEKMTAERIQSFLDQTEAALKDQDLQLAEALSNRALLLCQELSPEK